MDNPLPKNENAFIAEERAAEDQIARRQRLDWSLSWTGMFKSPLGLLYFFFFWAASSMLMVGVFTLLAIEIPRYLLPGGNRVLPIPTTIAIVLFWLWTRKAPGRALTRERAWSQALPFSVNGYEEALEDRPQQNEGALELRFQFDQEPTSDHLTKILSGDGGHWMVNPRNGHPMRDPGITRRSYDHNRPVQAWFHKLVEEQLIPLHRTFPFATVQIINRH